MKVANYLKLSTIDFPERLSAVIFTKGCNLSCPFCHNRELKEFEGDDFMNMEDIVCELLERKDQVDAVVFSGGEPTLQEDLLFWLGVFKEQGFSVKLDTNGTCPEVLEAALEAGLVDYVAMDVKSCPSGYGEVVGMACPNPGIIQNIEWSLNLLAMYNTPYELRTTLIKEHHDPERVITMAKWLGQESPWYLQQYRPPHWASGLFKEAYTREQMEQLKKELVAVTGFNDISLR